MEFSGRTVVITGAAGNLGRAVAQAFAARGATLALVDVRRDSLAGAYGEESATQMFAPTDLLDQQAVSAMAAAVGERFGGIDVLCNIAGGFRMGEPVHETSDDTWNFLFDLNARTVLHAVRAVVPERVPAPATVSPPTFTFVAPV